MTSPYMTSAEAAAYLRYTGPRAQKSLRDWLKAKGVPFKRRGREILILRDAIEDALQDGWKGQRQTLRRVS